MQLSANKTYRTLDWSRTGIRVKRFDSLDAGTYFSYGEHNWHANGLHIPANRSLDLIEETPTPQPFSYAACPTGPDGRKRAVTRDGREVVLLCNDMAGCRPILGWIASGAGGSTPLCWCLDGTYGVAPEVDLFVPQGAKRTVWALLISTPDVIPSGIAAIVCKSEAEAKKLQPSSPIIGIYPIEIEG